MFFTLCFTLFLVATSALSTPFGLTGRGCGTVISEQERQIAEAHFQQNKIAVPAGKSFTIKVYWHVISTENSTRQGNIPDSQIAQQIQVLNNDYKNVSIAWTLAGIDRTINPTWYDIRVPGSGEQTEMKDALRKGGAGDMNVYSVGGITEGQTGQTQLGYATFPQWYSDSSKNDGVVIRHSTLPDGSYYPYNLGKTLTHEAGHWAGLYLC